MRSKRTSETKIPTDVLDVRGEVWVCLDHSEGRHNLFVKAQITKGGHIFKAEMGSVPLDTSSLDCGRSRASDIIWEARRRERTG
jgi:hypothetical protein